MKTTVLTSEHKALGAKMAEFAGYEMPIVYSTIKEEHEAVRNEVGVFDVSHMGEFIIEGDNALDLIDRISSNNPAKLKIGQAQYSCFPNENGGIVDDFLLYRMEERQYMLVVNASNIEKDWNWITSFNTEGAVMRNISDKAGLLAIQGPKAVELVQKLTDVNVHEIPYYHFKVGSVAGISNVIISATGYTGSGGFELYVDNEHLKTLWCAVMEAGEAFNIKPAGLGARDTLRLEMGYCLYGNDISDTTSPIEAGLGWITKLKNRTFNSSEIFAKQRKEGVSRKLVGFIVDDRRVPRHGYTIESTDGVLLGEVTSGTLSPNLEKPIGMGYVSKDFAEVGQEICINTGRKTLPAKIVALPFVTIN